MYQTDYPAKQETPTPDLTSGFMNIHWVTVKIMYQTDYPAK